MKEILYYIVSLGLMVVGAGLASVFFLMSQGMDVPGNYWLSIIIALMVTILPGLFFFRVARDEKKEGLILKIVAVLELVFILTFGSVFVVLLGSVILPNPIFLPGPRGILKSIFYTALGSHLVALILLGANWIKNRF